MKTGKLRILLVGFTLFLVSCGNTIDANMSEEVDNFESVTQDNHSFGLADVDNKWWIAYFMYTNCSMVCPTTTPNMVKLQEELKNLDLNLEIVSFTVDPKNDTPKVLKGYAEENQVDLSNWTFLTGYDYNTIKELSEGSFKSILENGGPDGMQFSHSYNFFLVNPDRKVIKKYNGMSMNEVNTLMEDIKKVLK